MIEIKGPASVKRRMMIMIALTWVVIIVFGRLMPWASAAGLLILILSSYLVLVSAAMIHRKRKELKSPPVRDHSYQPNISILVPAHNEESVIAATIEGLLALDYPYFDLWVIDDRSDDQTPHILQQLQQRLQDPRFHWYTRHTSATPGKSAVLNEALHKVPGEVIAVFDADARVAPSFFQLLLPFLADDSVGGVQARKVIGNAHLNWLTHCQNFEYALDSYFQAGRDTIRGAVEFRGNGQLVKRKALEAVGGWNEYTLTDDLDLSSRFHTAGFDVRFAHKVVVYEEGILTIPPLIKQRRRWAEGALTRYLEYCTIICPSESASLRAKVDMMAYLVEFMFPLWVTSDYLYLGYHWLLGSAHELHLLSSIVMLPLLAIFFYSCLIIAVIRFIRPGILQTISGATLTSIYMVMIWVPVAFWVTLKILFQREATLDWGKTQHHGIAEVS